MSKDTGGSAFPNDGAWANGHPEGGMALRDYFAAHAVGAIIVATSAGQHMPRGAGETRDLIARDAYEMADAMLAERAKDGEP